jgi:hypothetical protein
MVIQAEVGLGIIRSLTMPKKLTLQAMQQLAESHGGRCLSDTYVNSWSKLLWQCVKGHQWIATPNGIQQGSWCPVCGHGRGGLKHLSIEEMRRIALSRGGKCLSTAYQSIASKLQWECSEGHTWFSAPSSVKDGHWCPECSGNVRLTIQDMHRLAQEQGGKCLSNTYLNNRTHLRWECIQGHQWTATPNHVREGKWCPKCGGTAKLTIQEMRRLAESRGGKCLTEVYAGNKASLLWECREGHRWKANANHIKKGEWCPVCAGHSKPSMDEIQYLAKERGGKCLSQNYRNSRTLLEWECAEGHQWRAAWSNIQGGQWCPTCSTGLGERICREYFSQLFQNSFPKTRPKWLVNKAGNQMELDGYCATLGIAFEHQGEQHYSTNTRFHNSELDVARRQEDDALKSELCAQRGITLVAIPAIPKRLPLGQVIAFIKEQLVAKGIPLPQGFDTRDVDINEAYRTGGAREVLNRLRTIAREHGGKCLSDTYGGSQSKLLWQCGEGHKWKAAPDGIKQGQWCPYCYGNVRKTLEEMKAIAAARGGKCLSGQYANVMTKLLWECSQGHRWKAKPNDVLNKGSWCPECAHSMQSRERRLGLPAMQALAASRGGRCLSDEYINSNTQLLWQCKEDHQWKAVPSSIQSGRWCPRCWASRRGRARRLGLSEMQSMAASRGGKCLSDEYINNHTHLLWQCKQGHQWRAAPNNVKSGTWCPDCRKNNPGRRQREAP